MIDENIITNLSVKITEYDDDIHKFKKARYIHVMFMLLSIISTLLSIDFIFGLGFMLIANFILIRRVIKRRKLSIQKVKLLDELNLLTSRISIDDYLELKQKIINAGTKLNLKT